MTDDQINAHARRTVDAILTELSDSLEQQTGGRPKAISITLPESAEGALMDLGGRRVGGIFCESGETPEVTTWVEIHWRCGPTPVLLSTAHVRRPATEAEVLQLAKHGSERRHRYRITS